jgi:hypothetical protein
VKEEKSLEGDKNAKWKRRLLYRLASTHIGTIKIV